MPEKPESIARDAFKSAKWDEICAGRSFSRADVPNLMLLCQWHAVVQRCIDDLESQGELQVAYANDLGDIKALPQLSTMKQASAEIRALNKQLGINDQAAPEPKRKQTKLYAIQAGRQKRQAEAANSR